MKLFIIIFIFGNFSIFAVDSVTSFSPLSSGVVFSNPDIFLNNSSI
jgi:hypothetical protein